MFPDMLMTRLSLLTTENMGCAKETIDFEYTILTFSEWLN